MGAFDKPQIRGQGVTILRRRNTMGSRFTSANLGKSATALLLIKLGLRC
jgi:hypothetical protein